MRTRDIADAILRDRVERQSNDKPPGLIWKRDGEGWLLLAGRRRFGRVVPDAKWPGMWRSTLSGGRLSDMANLSWAKNALLVAAERELEYEARTATTPSKCPENRGVFGHTAPPVRQNAREAPNPQNAPTPPPAPSPQFAGRPSNSAPSPDFSIGAPLRRLTVEARP
jgi:hypothetical protein